MVVITGTFCSSIFFIFIFTFFLGAGGGGAAKGKSAPSVSLLETLLACLSKSSFVDAFVVSKLSCLHAFY